jgi:hypothetical protein
MTEGKRTPGRSKSKRNDNIKYNLREKRVERSVWTELIWLRIGT